jgi:hypothetical protein
VLINKEEKRMNTRSHAAVLLLSALVPLAGCGDPLVGPEATEQVDPAHFALLLPALQQAREAQRTVMTSGGAIYNFGISQTLFADGRAIGVATLADPHDASRRFQYRFTMGRTACVQGTPVAFLTGQLDAAGSDAPTYGWMVHILPHIDQTALSRAGDRLRWEWEVDDPVGSAGEYFETPVMELSFAPVICDTE